MDFFFFQTGNQVFILLKTRIPGCKNWRKTICFAFGETRSGTLQSY